MKRLACLLLISLAVAAAVAPDPVGEADKPIQVIVEPAPTSNITVQAPAPPEATVIISADSIWWRLAEIGATLLGIVVAAWLIIWKMGRQSESSLALQKETAREALRADIYEKLSSCISEAVQAETESSAYVRRIPFSLRNFRSLNEKGILSAAGPPVVRERVLELENLDKQLSSTVLALITLFESYAIAAPDFDVFQHALSSALYDARDAFNPLHSELLTVLPMDMGPYAPPEARNIDNTYHHVPPPPDDNQLEKVQQLVNAYLSATDNIGSYLHDLRVEAQNTLLKDLYPGQRAPVRQPIDPAYKVITTDQADELRRYFLEDTPWGKSIKASEDWVRRRLAVTDDGENDL